MLIPRTESDSMEKVLDRMNSNVDRFARTTNHTREWVEKIYKTFPKIPVSFVSVSVYYWFAKIGIHPTNPCDREQTQVIHQWMRQITGESSIARDAYGDHAVSEVNIRIREEDDSCTDIDISVRDLHPLECKIKEEKITRISRTLSCPVENAE